MTLLVQPLRQWFANVTLLEHSVRLLAGLLENTRASWESPPLFVLLAPRRSAWWCLVMSLDAVRERAIWLVVLVVKCIDENRAISQYRLVCC